eukprot:TRINITY_DN57094_c0_g1_i1.p1 TRINITY_DN57094_c0_g1~~TRINITY_DN57094_c0_g1_i1.p1  ORF type:complete len:745 (-),score=111.50 TRINITY_DN57094_c0_g1_i1:376-2295(-)
MLKSREAGQQAVELVECLNDAATTVQTCARAKYSWKKAHRVIQSHGWATIVQEFCRSKLAEHRVQARRNNLPFKLLGKRDAAANRIQRNWRRHLTHNINRRISDENKRQQAAIEAQDRAAERIQAFYKKLRAKRRVGILRKKRNDETAAILEAERNQAARVIQKKERQIMARKRVNEMQKYRKNRQNSLIKHEAATDIQGAWKVHQAKVNVAEAKTFRQVREDQEIWQENQDFQKVYTQAAIDIARVYRGFRGRQKAKKRRNAILTIQSAWRVYKAKQYANKIRKELAAEHQARQQKEAQDELRAYAAIKIQCAWRRHAATKVAKERMGKFKGYVTEHIQNEAAATIQRGWRYCKKRRQEKAQARRRRKAALRAKQKEHPDKDDEDQKQSEDEAAAEIQRVWRGKKVRNNYKKAKTDVGTAKDSALDAERRHWAAVVIQCTVRRRQAKNRADNLRKTRANEKDAVRRNDAASFIQRAWCRYTARKQAPKYNKPTKLEEPAPVQQEGEVRSPIALTPEPAVQPTAIPEANLVDLPEIAPVPQLEQPNTLSTYRSDDMDRLTPTSVEDRGAARQLVRHSLESVGIPSAELSLCSTPSSEPPGIAPGFNPEALAAAVNNAQQQQQGATGNPDDEDGVVYMDL